jgi:TolB-like protein
MLRRVLYSVLIFIAMAGDLSAQDPLEPERPTSLAIVPFTAAMLGEEVWLGKAIADVLAQQLATMPDYVLVERTRLNSFLDEMDLQEEGFAGDPDARRLGRVAKVDQVIYGNFARAGETLTINLILVDLASQTPLQQPTVHGDLDQLHDLVAELSAELVEGRGRTLSGEELKRIHFRPTDSTPALRHFYVAFDHMDQGRFLRRGRTGCRFSRGRPLDGKSLTAAGPGRSGRHCISGCGGPCRRAGRGVRRPPFPGRAA